MALAKIEFQLKELDLCYSDIDRRSREQFRCVVFNLIALGTIIGVAPKITDNSFDLLAVVPWIHAVLGYYWIDNAYAISRQEHYIRTVLEPSLRFNNASRGLGYARFVNYFR